MFVSGWKWYSGIKDGPSLPLLSCESSVPVKKTLMEKKTRCFVTAEVQVEVLLIDISLENLYWDK